MSKPLIRDVVQTALTTGYLSLEAETQLRNLLQTTKYSSPDLWAFHQLQIAAMTGKVTQQSRENRDSLSLLVSRP
jgi:hypothetical protein